LRIIDRLYELGLAPRSGAADGPHVSYLSGASVSDTALLGSVDVSQKICQYQDIEKRALRAARDTNIRDALLAQVGDRKRRSSVAHQNVGRMV